MNEVIHTLTNHRSFRNYSKEQLQDHQLDAIIAAAQAAPSWIHGQQVTVIIVQDEARKLKLSKICGNQKHIIEAPTFLVFCADFYRAKLASEIEGVPFESIHDVDSLIVGATDVGIALSNAIAASESLGLSTVPIGGIRRNPLDAIDLLKLPTYVLPIVGLCIGYGQIDPGLNPRLPRGAFAHVEEYQKNQLPMIKEYNQSYKKYLTEQSDGKRDATWTKRVADFYKKSHYNNQYQDVPKMLKQQGFSCDDLHSEK
ncbi:NADPH-dependent oxidoreductase [Metabacillus sp. HB246100]|uniref:NADPH-dependent oxidoreductase n=1 Tax=Bacillus weihaiensis TaxID=1547283 RepID=UPI00235619D1|nr:NADPH-dependent oxidoreductase [Bacillus weihaiensis]